MGKKNKKDKKFAKEVSLFSKTDMERVGLFKELGYVTVNERYNSKGPGEFFCWVLISNLKRGPLRVHRHRLNLYLWIDKV